MGEDVAPEQLHPAGQRGGCHRLQGKEPVYLIEVPGWRWGKPEEEGPARDKSQQLGAGSA